ncbi:hypothetical protein P8452_11856 [Trifolium repens]|nr:hypothetical protein P8452_11856 [Trifolium repens]
MMWKRDVGEANPGANNDVEVVQASPLALQHYARMPPPTYALMPPTQRPPLISFFLDSLQLLSLSLSLQILQRFSSKSNPPTCFMTIPQWSLKVLL